MLHICKDVIDLLLNFVFCLIRRKLFSILESQPAFERFLYKEWHDESAALVILI